MNGLNWRDLHGEELLDEMPCGVMVMDRDMQIVRHNNAFEAVYGASVGKACYTVYKNRNEPCLECVARGSFEDGRSRVLEETGTDQYGRTIHYLAQLMPLRDGEDEIAHLAAITTDLTATKRLQGEYQTLFEKVPCYVTVLNRDRRVVKANEMFRRTFGEPRGEHCYKLFKHRQQECAECPAALTFADGGSHTSRHVGTSQDGATTHYVVSTAPLLQGDGEITHVIEMCLDITAVVELEEELQRANIFRKALVENSLDAIVVLDAEQKVVLLNKAAEKLWGIEREALIGRRVGENMLPEALCRERAPRDAAVLLRDTRITNLAGEEIPVQLAGVTLTRGDKLLGGAVIAQDLREIKEMEREKLANERLAAVGQTVAGLAHGIKNVLMGVEGGMYAFQSGMQKGDQDRMLHGWQMLEENIGRVSAYVREFLEFARGRTPTVRLVDPNRIARQVVQLFEDKAALAGILFDADLQPDIPYALLDAEGIHTCLTNLVSNALDACETSEKADPTVRVVTTDADGVLTIAVADNGSGIDHEIRKKIFTSFFSSKGAGKGTGLGLLTTKKIVQEHGGRVAFTSEPGEGSEFQLIFPRDRLPRSTDDEDGGDGAAAESAAAETATSIEPVRED